MIWIVCAHYAYLPTKDQVAYNEIYAGVTFKAFSAKYWYSEDFGNTGAPASYIEANASIPLPSDFGVSLHAGHSSGDYWKDAYKRGYTDYSIGVSKTLGQFTDFIGCVDGSAANQQKRRAG